MDPAAARAEAVLADVAGIGPFFAVATGPADAAGPTDSADPADPPWRPLRELHADPAPLRAHLARVGAVLGAGDRVAASIAFQGLAARLVAPPFAAAVLHGAVPRFTTGTLLWRPAASGPWPLRWTPGRLDDVPDAAAPAALARLLDDLLAPLVAVVRAQAAVGGRVLWGGAGASVGSARRLVVAARPGAAGRAAALAAELLRTGPFAGSAAFLPPRPPDLGWTFRRRTCCLYYRVPGGGLCEDCVLHSAPARLPARLPGRAADGTAPASPRLLGSTGPPTSAP